jgi:YD repeat-containing protein
VADVHVPVGGVPPEEVGGAVEVDVGDVSCTALEYVHHTGKNLIGLTKQTLSTATPCATADFTSTTKLASGSRTAYDGGEYGAALADSTRGLATRTWSLKADGSGFRSDGTVEFDSRGRVVKATDPDSESSTTTYRMEGGQTFGVTETNSLGHSSVQEIEPGRGTATKSTDANGHVTQSVFDPSGRLVEAWAPGRTPSSASVPDFAAEYHIPEVDPEEPDRLPPYVVTKTRGHENRVESSVTVYDGLGRERQTQEEATGGGRLITDTLYNSSGEVWQTNNAYLATGKPSGQLVFAEAGAQGEFVQRMGSIGAGRVEELASLCRREGLEAFGPRRRGLDVEGDVPGRFVFADSRFWQHSPTAQHACSSESGPGCSAGRWCGAG